MIIPLKEFNQIAQEVNFSLFVPKTSEISVKITCLLNARSKLWNSPEYSSTTWKSTIVLIDEIALLAFAITALVETVFLGCRLPFCNQKDRELVFEKINSSIFCIGWATVGLIENLSKEILFEARTSEYEVRELFRNRYGLSWVFRPKDDACNRKYQEIRKISFLNKIYTDFSNSNQPTSGTQEFNLEEEEHHAKEFCGKIKHRSLSIEPNINDSTNVSDSVNNLVSTLKEQGFFRWWPQCKKQWIDCLSKNEYHASHKIA